MAVNSKSGVSDAIVAVGEVAIGRGAGDAELRRQLAQRHRLFPALLHHRQRRGDEGALQVAVMVAVLGHD